MIRLSALVTAIVLVLVSALPAVAQTRGTRIAGKESLLVDFYSRTWAVVIGIDDYPQLTYNQQLQQAVRDARGVEQVLRDQYGFDQIVTLYNEQATKNGILKVLQGDLLQTSEDDAVFVFFAGHGNTVTTADGDLGYLLPYDGSFKDNELYKNISMTTLKNDVAKAIPAKHIFFVMDACYSGLLLAQRGPGDQEPQADRLDYLREITRERARQVLTAGGKGQMVLDGGRNGHSVFTGRLLQALEEADGYITAKEIGYRVPEKVFYDAQDRGHKQQPQFGRLLGQGDFVFVKRHDLAAALGSDVDRALADADAAEAEAERLRQELAAAKALQKKQEAEAEAERLRSELEALQREGEQKTVGRPKLAEQSSGRSSTDRMVFITSGSFQMGSSKYDNEKPIHTVYVDGFWMDTHEVSVENYRGFRPDYQPPSWSSCAQCPATNVSWHDARAFYVSLGKRLPTEAEWEKACKGPEGSTYAWGSAPDKSKGRFGLAWEDGAGKVGSYAANGYGLYNMSGNVWEWCSDRYDGDYYSKSLKRNPEGPSSGQHRVLRGGSWYYPEGGVRCANRDGSAPDNRIPDRGFRCVRTE